MNAAGALIRQRREIDCYHTDTKTALSLPSAAGPRGRAAGWWDEMGVLRTVALAINLPPRRSKVAGGVADRAASFAHRSSGKGPYFCDATPEYLGLAAYVLT